MESEFGTASRLDMQTEHTQQLNDNTNLIYSAIGGGFDVVLQRALEAKANVDAVARGQQSPPLLFAMMNGHSNAVQMLLNARANLEAEGAFRQFEQMKPLHIAAIEGRLEDVKMLLKAKANVKATNKELEQPVHLASAEGHAPVVQVLLDA